jgi:hypothetical protein
MLPPAESSEDLGRRQSAVQSQFQEAHWPASPEMLVGNLPVSTCPSHPVEKSQC